jgi:hypothetical protein
LRRGGGEGEGERKRWRRTQIPLSGWKLQKPKAPPTS